MSKSKTFSSSKDSEIVGKNILMLRKKAGLTTREVGKKLGMSPATVTNCENGKVNPEMSTLVKFANLFKVELTDLLNPNLLEFNPKKNIADRITHELVESLDSKALERLSQALTSLEALVKESVAKSKDQAEKIDTMNDRIKLLTMMVEKK